MKSNSIFKKYDIYSSVVNLAIFFVSKIDIALFTSKQILMRCQ
jgi:hypothetical protein